MAPFYDEKRVFPRVKLGTPLRFQLRGSPDSNTTISDDLSIGGVGFISDRFLASNAPVMLEFSLLSRALKPIGRVAWSSPFSHSNRYRVGVEFTEFDPVEKRFLQDYLSLQEKSA